MWVDKADGRTPGCLFGLCRVHPCFKLAGDARVARLALAGGTMRIGAGAATKAILCQIGAVLCRQVPLAKPVGLIALTA